MFPHKLHESGLDLAHCILLMIYQRVEIQTLVVAARDLDEIQRWMQCSGIAGASM